MERGDVLPLYTLRNRPTARPCAKFNSIECYPEMRQTLYEFVKKNDFIHEPPGVFNVLTNLKLLHHPS